MQNLSNILKIFLENNIDFVLIGGFAGVFYGSTTVTRDLDICALVNPEQIDTLRNILRDLNPRHRMTPARLSFLKYPEDTSNVKNLFLETNLGIVDILSEVKGVGNFDNVVKKAITVEFFGHKCKVISIDDLISAKEAMGREKDLLTVKELKIIKNKLS